MICNIMICNRNDPKLVNVQSYDILIDLLVKSNDRKNVNIFQLVLNNPVFFVCIVSCISFMFSSSRILCRARLVNTVAE